MISSFSKTEENQEEIDLSIVIKALNEEAKIYSCLESVFEATKGIKKKEVILIDSISDDLTVDIAKNFPIQIYQIKNIKHQSCGAAAELGYRKSRGKYLYLIDGDMELIDGFIEKALEILDSNENIAGVGGILVDKVVTSFFDKKRSDNYKSITQAINVKSLGGGGIYKREAIESVGYFSHLSLKASEEAELGVRLSSEGWILSRIPVPSAHHTSHKTSTFKTVLRSWKNGRLASNGVFIKTAIFRKWWLRSLLSTWYAGAAFLINITTITIFLVADGLLGIFLAFIPYIISLAIMSIKNRDLKSAAISLASWNIALIATIYGFFEKTESPSTFIDSRQIK